MDISDLAPFIVEAIQNIERELSGRLAAVTYSSWGKDSSAVAALTIAAMENMRNRGEGIPELYVIHSDTKLENALVAGHAIGEGEALRRFAASTGLPIHYVEAQPNLSNNYLVNLIGGRAVASVMGMDRVCQQTMKKDPLTKATKKVMKAIRDQHGFKQSEMKPKYVLELFGMRESESAVRGEKMRKNQSTGEIAKLNTATGTYQLCPIAKWGVDEVRFLMMQVSMGDLQTYSDFSSLWEIYKDANGECAIVTSDRLEGDASAKRGGCSSMMRHGCWVCCMSDTDRSLEELLTNPDYDYMRPQNMIRNWLLANHFDPQKRRWLARSVDENGMIQVKPNSYSPEFALELFRFIVTADRDEAIRAEREGITPAFLSIGPVELYGIEALWSRYGMHKPYKAFKEYDDIWNGGASYYPEAKPTMYERWDYMPNLRVPFVTDSFESFDNGLRDSLLESMSEGRCAEGGAMTISKQKVGSDAWTSFLNTEVDDEFEFDEEGLEFHTLMSFDRCVRKHDLYANVEGVFAGVSIKEFLGQGFLKLSKGTHATLDQALRIANQLHDHGLYGDVISDPVALIHKLHESKGFSDEEANEINKTLRSPLFRLFYRDHYERSAEPLAAGILAQGLADLIATDYSALFAA